MVAGIGTPKAEMVSDQQRYALHSPIAAGTDRNSKPGKWHAVIADGKVKGN